jgi:hypothetical protein
LKKESNQQQVEVQLDLFAKKRKEMSGAEKGSALSEETIP